MTWRQEQVEVRTNIRAELARARMTQRELAELLEVPQPTLSALMTGRRQWWVEIVYAIAAALSVEPAELVGRAPTPLPLADLPGPGGHPRSDWQKEVRAKLQQRPRSRALCCCCGTMTTVNNGGHRRGFVGDLPGRRPSERFAGRMLQNYRCETCQKVTQHAVIRDDEHRDVFEEGVRAPSQDGLARDRVTALLERITAFGVEVRWSAKLNHRKRPETPPVISVRCVDEVTNSWRMVLNRLYPWNVIESELTLVWKAIALGDTSWWTGAGLSPTDSVVVFPSSDDIDTAVAGLLDEIRSSAPAVLQQIVLDVTDRAESADTSTSYPTQP